jgi:hypothetical protein
MDPTGEHPMTELSDSDELELELLSLAFDANMARQPMPDGSDPMDHIVKHPDLPRKRLVDLMLAEVRQVARILTEYEENTR